MPDFCFRIKHKPIEGFYPAHRWAQHALPDDPNLHFADVLYLSQALVYGVTILRFILNI